MTFSMITRAGFEHLRGLLNAHRQEPITETELRPIACGLCCQPWDGERVSVCIAPHDSKTGRWITLYMAPEYFSAYSPT